MKATDQDIIELVEANTVMSATLIGNHFMMSRQAAYKRCEQLVENGKLNKVDLGRDTAYTPSYGEENVETDTLQGNVRDDNNLAVDITTQGDSRTSLLIQGAPGGYKLDAWWDNEDGDSRQSCVHFEFSDQSNDYAYDNRHSRDVGLDTTDEDEIIIVDSHPRAENVGYDPVTMHVDKCDDGFTFTVSWTDEYGEDHITTITAPLVDPRVERDKFYDIEEQNYERMYPELTSD